MNDSNNLNSHNHTINNVGNHTHNTSSSVSVSGGNATIDFTPKYYNVVFLMAIR